MINKKWMIIVAICLVLSIAAAMIGPIMSDVEQPSYELIASANEIEIRQYAPMLIAEVDAQGTRKEAIGDGFRLLANYIFGNNTVQQEIAMTAPVQQQLLDKVWKISFVMPAQYSLETLPKPNHESIRLNPISAKRFIVIQFSGTNSNSNIAKHEKQLMQYIEKQKIRTTGSVKYAFYSPPWTLPFMQRNEVMIEVKQ